MGQHCPQVATKRTASVFNRSRIILTKSSSPSTRPEDGSIAPSIVVLLNTPLILLPMRLIPKVSPLFDVFLWAESETMRGMVLMGFIEEHDKQEPLRDGAGGGVKK